MTSTQRSFMRAAQLRDLTGIRGIEVVEVDVPIPAPDEVLIEVRSVGLSAADLLMSSGSYQTVPSTPFTLGMDLAGVVQGVGAAVTRFAVGDRVAATAPYGAAAEFAAIPEVSAFPLPGSLSFDVGAALPVNYLTALFAFTVRGGLAVGETVLVHGAAGGLGSAAAQVARALGARVIAVVSDEKKASSARKGGADEVVFTEGFRDAVMDATGGRGVDVVFDPVGAPVFDDSLRCLAVGGRHLVLGFVGGAPPVVKAGRLLLRNIDVRGVSWTGHSDPAGSGLIEHWNRLLGMAGEGALRPLIGSRFSLGRIRDALSEIEGRRAIGKTIIDPTLTDAR